MNLRTKMIMGMLSLTMLNACGSNSTSTTKLKGNGTVSLSLTGLEATLGQHYEGWLITEEGPVSTGRFNIDVNGNINVVDVSGAVTNSLGSKVATFSYNEQGSLISDFVLTIEPNNDSDPAPSATHYVAGSFNSNRVADTTTEETAAIGHDFTETSGDYILATPTNGPTTHNQGIWFLIPEDAGAGIPAMGSLEIPDLTNSGWAYEGWVLEGGVPTTTGVFFKSDQADDDLGGPGAGPMGAPPFPGQDFIVPTRVLNTGATTTVITIEPFPDADTAPFTLKILKHDIANSAPIVTPIALENFSNEESVSIEVTLP